MNAKQQGEKKARKQYSAEFKEQALKRAEKDGVAAAARKYKATTHSNHTLPVAPNLLEQDFSATAPNQKWVSDITYIATDEGWLYLAVVLDLYSRLSE